MSKVFIDFIPKKECGIEKSNKWYKEVEREMNKNIKQAIKEIKEIKEKGGK